MIPRNLKNFSLFVNGKGYAGLVTELTLPKLSVKTEEFRAAGMDTSIPIDMGLDALSCSFTLAEYTADILSLFGLRDGSKVNLTFRGALDDGGPQVSPIVINITGMWKEVDLGSWQPGSMNQLKVSVNAIYYKLAMDSDVLIEIDVINMVRSIKGKDQLANIRKALQL